MNAEHLKTMAGKMIVPYVVPPPTNDDEAHQMVMEARDYLARHAHLPETDSSRRAHIQKHAQALRDYHAKTPSKVSGAIVMALDQAGIPK